MDVYYNQAFLKDNGRPTTANNKAAYYWMEGDRLRTSPWGTMHYWSPYSQGSIVHRGMDLYAPTPTTCEILNEETMRLYSTDEATIPDDCMGILIQGGPLEGDSKLVVGDCVLPAGVLDVFDIPLEDTVTLPDHDLWELIKGGGSTQPMQLVIALVTDRYWRYAITYEGVGKYQVLPSKGIPWGGLVHTGTLEACLNIAAHLQGAWEDSKNYTLRGVSRMCDDMVGEGDEYTTKV